MKPSRALRNRRKSRNAFVESERKRLQSLCDKYNNREWFNKNEWVQLERELSKQRRIE